MTGIARAAVIAVAMVAAGCTSADPGSDQTGRAAARVATEDTGFHGTLLDPPADRPDLVLRDTAGRRFDFRSQPAGEAIVLFFGYTHCPDVCPTTMADLGVAYRALSPAVRRRISVVFVTEDPRRDTPPVLRRWLDQFHPDFVGLLGGGQRTARVLDELHLPQTRRNPNPSPTVSHPPAHTHTHGDNDGYGVDHNGIVYLFGPDDRVLIYTGGTRPSEYADDLAKVVA